jgi:alkylresorcinol/alkylpyrone synthase
MQILSVRGALPEHRYTQQEITDAFAGVIMQGSFDEGLMRRFHANAGVDQRYLAMPLEEYGLLADFGASNDRFIEVGVQLVARLHDYLVGHPGEVAVLVSVELCSLTVQRDDVTVPNLVASGLFGDGAAAVVARGGSRDGEEPGHAEVLGSRSRLYPDSERTMGWDVASTGLRIVLDANVPDLVREYVGDDVDAFVGDFGLTRDDIEWWVCHPGGPKVLEAIEDTLRVPRSAVQLTWDSLARIGNLSSSSVLHVFEDTLRDRPPRPGSYGMLMAMGPGFCSELVLLRAPSSR